DRPGPRPPGRGPGRGDEEDGGLVNTLATYNIKGGVGKTTAAVNLAYLAAGDGRRTLLWDLDPQGAASYLLRIGPRVKGGGKALIRGKTSLDQAVKPTEFDRLDLVPADFTYRNLDLVLDAAKKPTPPGSTAWTWSRPTSPTATWTWSSTPPRSPPSASPACSARWPATTTWPSSTARRASRWSPRTSSTPPARCWCP